MIRRTLRRLLTAALIVQSAPIFATGLVSESLDDLEKYLKAASSLVLQVATELDSAKLEALPVADRKQAKEGLATLSGSLADLFISQTSLVHDLQFYVQLAKNPAQADQRDAFWNSQILTKTRNISSSIAEIKKFVEESQFLSVTLSSEEYMALADNLTSRAIVLRTFEDMEPPKSADDVVKLEALIQHYSALIENLRQLRLAVERASLRLKDA